MKIYCPNCGVKGSADDSYSGRKIRCPKCQEMFDLTPDMAIDQSEFLTVDLEAEGLKEEVVQDALQKEDVVPLDSPADVSLDIDGEPRDVVEPLEPLVAEKGGDPEGLGQEGDSLDWGDFGAELDKEIAEIETEGATADLLVEDFEEEDGPIADLGDFDLDRIPDNNGPADDLTHIQSDDNKDTVDESVDSNPATQMASEVVMPLFVDDDKNDVVVGEDTPDVNDSAEVLAFAANDFPEDTDDVVAEKDSDDVVVEEEPYGIDKEQCWQCGKKDSVGEPFIAIDGRLYCTDCLPADEVEEDGGVSAADVAAAGVVGAASIMGSGLAGDGEFTEEAEAVESLERKKDFTVGGVVRESWEMVKGIKGAVWAGSAIMYLVLLVIIAAGNVLLPDNVVAPEGGGLVGYLFPALLQVVIEVVTMLFIAGLLFMGIRRVVGDQVSWKMIFHGFSCTGKIIVVTILQFILVTIGFLLLILPGIYLLVGYAMAIPLIVDKDLSPWEALESSRKAVHKVWWKVAALYVVMSLLFLVAAIPLGIGLIWVWPMIMVAAGVVYHRLFTE